MLLRISRGVAKDAKWKQKYALAWENGARIGRIIRRSIEGTFY